jgi:hypothetical protein
MGTVTENKKTIINFKALNLFVLETMIDKDPEIYSAVAKVLDSIERKYFYSSETETKKWTLEDFADTKIVVDTPGKSQRFQELLFSLGIAWSSIDVYEESKRDTVQHTDKQYLIVRQEGTAFTGYELIFIKSKDTFYKSDKKIIFYDDIFPPLTTTTETETKQWTLDDFKGTRILVSSEEKSRRFQELIFSLGGEWVTGEKKTPVLLDTKFLIVDMQGEISFRSAEDFQDSVYKQIFYNNIFPEDQDKKQKEPVSTTYTTLKDFYKSKIEVNEKQSVLLQEYLFTLGSKWFTGNRDLKWFSEKYLIIDEKGILRPVTKFAFDEIYYKRIYYSDIFRTDIERAFKDKPLETDFLTWPKPEIADIYRIEKNKGDRKSPTQSAGKLKDLYNRTVDQTALFATYFRGNDGNWYRLYEDKNGTWRWSKQATPKQLK